MQILLITYNYSTSVCMQLATAHIIAIIILCYFDNLHDQLSLWPLFWESSTVWRRPDISSLAVDVKKWSKTCCMEYDYLTCVLKRSCGYIEVTSTTALLRQRPFDGALTTVLPWQNPDGTTMVLASCRPNNALGEAKLAYTVSLLGIFLTASSFCSCSRGTYAC